MSTGPDGSPIEWTPERARGMGDQAIALVRRLLDKPHANTRQHRGSGSHATQRGTDLRQARPGARDRRALSELSDPLRLEPDGPETRRAGAAGPSGLLPRRQPRRRVMG